MDQKSRLIALPSQGRKEGSVCLKKHAGERYLLCYLPGIFRETHGRGDRDKIALFNALPNKREMGKTVHHDLWKAIRG